MNDAEMLTVARNQARAGLAEAGIPIGAALVVDGKVIGTGRSKRVQRGSTTLHGEELLPARGVEVVVLDGPECAKLMGDFLAQNPALWNENIGLE